MWIRTNSAIGVCAAVAATLVGLGLAASTSAAAAGTHRPRCHGQRATIVGTRHRDVIHGTDKRDVIVAGGGWDRIYGNGGSDLICAGRVPM